MYRLFLCAILAVTSLAACGGGGGSSGGGGPALTFDPPGQNAQIEIGQPALATARYEAAYLRLEQKYGARIRPGKGVTIAIIDTLADVNVFQEGPHWEFIGADIRSEALPGSYEPDFFYCDESPCINSQNWRSHGTQVSSIIVAQRNQATVPPQLRHDDFHGIAWGASVRTYGIELGDPPGRSWIYQRFSPSALRSSDPAYANLLEYVLVRSRPDVVNMSFGVPGLTEHYTSGEATSSMQQSARLISAWSSTVFVMSAGNTNGRLCTPGTQNCNNGDFVASSPSVRAGMPVFFPDTRDNFVGAVAVDHGGNIARFSNRCGIAARWCLAAPGVNLNTATTYWDNGHQAFYADYSSTFSGTSAAAPFISGSLAFVKHYFRHELTMPEVLARLYATAQVTPDTVPTGAQCPEYLDLDGDRSECELSSETGQGVVDLDAATRPVGAISIGSSTVSGTLNSYVELPAAYGDVTARLASVSMTGFDALNAPFRWPASHFVRTADRNTTAIPSLERLPALNAGLVAGSLGLRPRPFDSRGRWSAYGANQTVGVRYAPSQALGFGTIVNLDTNQGGRATGIFGRQVRSGLAWVQLQTGRELGAGWHSWASLSVGAGKPSYSSGVLALSGSAFSAWEVALRNDSWQLALAQPWRAESGRGHLQYSTGRTVAGERLYAEKSFSLIPSGRELELRLRHSRQFGLGQLAAQLSAHVDAGHVRDASEGRVGLIWRWAW